LIGFLRGQPINLDTQFTLQTTSRNQYTPVSEISEEMGKYSGMIGSARAVNEFSQGRLCARLLRFFPVGSGKELYRIDQAINCLSCVSAIPQ